MTAFTFHSKFFLASSHSIIWQIQKRFFLLTADLLFLSNWECYEILTHSLQIVLPFVCLLFSPLFLRDLLLLSFPLQPVTAWYFICSRPFTWLISVTQLFSQPVITCFQMPLRKLPHLFFSPVVASFCLFLTAPSVCQDSSICFSCCSSSWILKQF